MKRPTILKGAEREGADMTLADHLRELRRRLVICAGAVFLLMIPAWFLYPFLIDTLNQPYCDALRGVSGTADCNFLVTNLLDPFSLRLKVAGYGGVFLAMPVILWQLWRFIAPGLYKRERRYAILFTGSAFLLFVLGAVVAYFTLTQAVDFLVRVGGDDIDIRSGPTEFVRLSLFMMTAFGVGFEFPILLISLQLIGVVTPQQLSKWRRVTVLIIVVLAAAITPSGDPVSLAALSVPMYLFYELSILIGRLLLRRRRKAEAKRSSESGTPA